MQVAPACSLKFLLNIFNFRPSSESQDIFELLNQLIYQI